MSPTDKELLNKETRERWLASYGLKPYDGGVTPMQVPSTTEFKGGEKPPELVLPDTFDRPWVFSEDFSQFPFSDLRKMLAMRKRITPEDTAALPSSAEERDDVSEELLSPHKQSQASSPVSSFIPLEPLSPFAPEMQMEDNKQDSRKRKAEPTIASAKRQSPSPKEKTTNSVPVETVGSDNNISEFVFDDDNVREAEPAPTVPLNTRSQGSTSPTPTVPATYVDLFGVSKKERKKWIRQWTRNILMKPAKKEEELSRQFQCLSIANWPARRQAGKADMSTQTSAFVALMWRTALLASSLSKNIAFGLLRVICENLRKTLYDAPNVVNAQQAKLFVENRFMGACTAWLHVMQKHGEMHTTFMNLMCAVVEAWRVDAGVMSQYTWHSQLKWYCGLPQALVAVIKEADATIVSNATACLQNLAPPVQQTAAMEPQYDVAETLQRLDDRVARLQSGGSAQLAGMREVAARMREYVRDLSEAVSKLQDDARIADEVVQRLSATIRPLHARVTGTCLPHVPHSWEACVNEFPDENSLPPFRGEELQWSADFKKVPRPRNSFARLMASGKDWPPEYQLSQGPVGETLPT